MTIPSSIAIMAMIECPPLCKKPPPCTALVNSMRKADQLFVLPKVILCAQLIQAFVRLISAWHYIADLKRLGHGAAGLFKMGTVIKPTIADIHFKIPEIVLKLPLIYRLHHLDVKRGKARSIGYKCIISDIVKLNVSRCVLAAAELIAYGGDFDVELRNDRI